jgi:hypothetical protein
LSSPPSSAAVVVELLDLLIFGLYFELSVFKALSCEELEELETDDSEIDRDARFNVAFMTLSFIPSSDFKCELLQLFKASDVVFGTLSF